MEEREIAERLKAQVEELNVLMRQAQEAGLSVTYQTCVVNTLCNTGDCELLTVRVSKEY